MNATLSQLSCVNVIGFFQHIATRICRFKLFTVSHGYLFVAAENRPTLTQTLRSVPPLQAQVRLSDWTKLLKIRREALKVKLAQLHNL